MAIRIRCSECKKRLSIDEAFAGGVCRCPFCSALIYVGRAGGGEQGRADRPDAPSHRPQSPGISRQAVSRPIAPGQGDATSDTTGSAEADVPTAQPARMRGKVAIILSGLGVAMIGLLVVLGVRMGQVSSTDSASPEAPGADIEAGPADLPVRAEVDVLQSSSQVADEADGGPDELDGPDEPDELGDQGNPGDMGVELVSPVLYCIDSGATMVEYFDYAMAMTRLSAKSLGAGGKFNIMLCTEGGRGSPWTKMAFEGYQVAGQAGDDLIAERYDLTHTGGVTDMSRSLSVAMSARPGTIVLFARQEVGSTRRFTTLAKRRGVRVVVVALAADGRARASLARLAARAGGQGRSYSLGLLLAWEPDLE